MRNISANIYTCRFPVLLSTGNLLQIELGQNIRYLRLTDREVFLIFQNLAHDFGILRLVRLCPEGMYSRSFGNVEHLGLDKSLVDIFRHFSAQSVDLPDKMSLGGTSNMRITGHHGNAVHIHGKDDRAQSQTAAGECSFAACMTGSDHAYICFNSVFHKVFFLSQDKL